MASLITIRRASFK
ncbi:hypothetical protein Tco_1116482, partial [Tanacetum coccineum]